MFKCCFESVEKFSDTITLNLLSLGTVFYLILLNIFILDIATDNSFTLNENNQPGACSISRSSTSTKVTNKKKKIRENKSEITDGSVNWLFLMLYELINNGFRRR